MLESFKDQMYLLSSVTRLSFEILKESVLFKYLVLKVFPVSPTGFLFHVVFSRNCGLVDLSPLFGSPENTKQRG